MTDDRKDKTSVTESMLSLNEIGAVSGGEERVLGVREMRQLEEQVRLAKQDGMTKEQFLAAVSQSQQVQEFVIFIWDMV